VSAEDDRQIALKRWAHLLLESIARSASGNQLRTALRKVDEDPERSRKRVPQLARWHPNTTKTGAAEPFFCFEPVIDRLGLLPERVVDVRDREKREHKLRPVLAITEAVGIAPRRMQKSNPRECQKLPREQPPAAACSRLGEPVLLLQRQAQKDAVQQILLRSWLL